LSYYFNSTSILYIALIFALGMNLWSYWNSDKVALSMARARPADPAQFQELHNVVENLAITAGLPKPRVYVIDDPAPNAFATGRNPQHSAVAATTGLLQIMDRAELEGVLAHELSHVRNYDILISTIAVTLVGFLALLCDLGLRLPFFGGLGGNRDDNGGDAAIFIIALSLVFIILAPIAAKLMQFAVSRRREALADVSGVYITRNPQGLISALEKLRENPATVHHA